MKAIGGLDMVPRSFIVTLSVFIILCFVFTSTNARYISRSTVSRVSLQAIIKASSTNVGPYVKALVGEISGLRKDKRAFRLVMRHFALDGNVSILDSESPPKITNSFCQNILMPGVITVMQIYNPYIFRPGRESAQYISQLLHVLGLPVITWEAENLAYGMNDQNNRFLRLAPTIRHQAQAAISLLKLYNWTEFSIVSSLWPGNEDFSLSLKELVDKSNKGRKRTPGSQNVKLNILKSISFAPSSSEAVRKQLLKINETDTRIILLYANKTETYEIMEQAEEIGLTTKDYVWILSQTCVGNSFDPGENPKESKAPSPYSLGALAFIVSYDEETVREAMRMAVKIWFKGLESLVRKKIDSKKLKPELSCATNYTRRMFWQSGQLMYEAMKAVKFDGVEFDEHGVNKHAQIRILNIQPGEGRRKIWREVGRWSTSNDILMQGITWMGNSPFPPRGKPEKHFVRIATLHEEPYVMYRDTENGKCGHSAVYCAVQPNDTERANMSPGSNKTVQKCCVGLSIDLLRIFAERLNFNFELFEVEDQQWGAPNLKTGEWNGLVRVLMDGKADMVITSLKITPERNTMVEFSLPWLETGITIIVSIREGAISPTAFLEPFDITSWLLILLMCISAVAFMICVFEWYSPNACNKGNSEREPYDYPSWLIILVFSVHATGASIFIFEWLSPYGLNQGHNPLRDHKFSLFRSFWLIWAMLFGASVSTDNPRGVSSRFLANIWALFSLVFLASYTANLAAFMITKEEFYNLQGIQDWRLSQPYRLNPPFRYGTISNGSTETNIRQYHPEKHEYMIKKKLMQPSVPVGLQKVKDDSIQAFIYDATVLEYWAGKDERCRLKTVGNWYAMTGYGVAFPKQTKWLDKINKVILDLQEDGEIARLQKFWLSGACHTKKKKHESSNSLGILNFTSAFILLAGGMLLGIMLLILEHCYFRFCRKSLRKYDKCGCCALVSLSMGQSLTFERSVIEAVDLYKKHKCRDPVCETQVWKIRHELDLALMKIDRLENRQRNEDSKADNTEPSQSTSQIIIRSEIGEPPPYPAPSYPDNVTNKHMGAIAPTVNNLSSNNRQQPGGSQDSLAKAASLRRSPSYTRAVEQLEEEEKPVSMTRYFDGKYYVHVNSNAQSESGL